MSYEGYPPAYVIKDYTVVRDLDRAARVTARTVLITLAIDVADYEAESGESLTEGMVEKIGQDANEDFAGVFGYTGWSLELTDKTA